MRRINRYITVVLVVLLFIYLALLDTLARPIFEHQATEIYGAEVSIDSIKISPFIGKVTLFNLQVADRSDAMRNLARAERVYLDLEILKLADNIAEIEELEIDGLVMFSRRGTEAVILRPLLDDDSGIAMASLPNFELPDADALIKIQRAKLDADMDQFKQALSAEKIKWQQQIATLPNTEDIARYKQRIREVKRAEGGLGKIAAINKAQTLYAEVNGNIEAIQSMQQQFRGDLQEMRGQIDQAADLPQKHVDELISSLGLSSDQLALIGSRILRGDLAGLTEQILAPLRYNASGEVNSETTMPIYVRHATINGEILPSAAGLQATGQMQNFAWPLELADQPAVLVLEGKTPDGGSLSINASVDHRGSPTDSFAVKLNNLPLRQMSLSGTDQLKIELEQTLANVDGEISVNGEALSGSFTQHLTETLFNLELAENAGDSARLLAAVLKGSQEFTMEIGFAGTLQSPKISFRADLDSLIENTLRDAITDRVAALSFELRNQMSKELGPEIAAAREEFASLETLQSELKRTLQQLSGIAN